jgi:hypothetical protein
LHRQSVYRSQTERNLKLSRQGADDAVV